MVAVLRLAFGALTLTALTVNLANGLDLPTLRVANDFSYFTNHSKAALALSLAWIANRRRFGAVSSPPC